MSQMNVAVVNCSLPIDHEDHVTIRPATDEEIAVAADARAEVDRRDEEAPPTIEERLAALEARHDAR